jgi:hypothetical protein
MYVLVLVFNQKFKKVKKSENRKNLIEQGYKRETFLCNVSVSEAELLQNSQSKAIHGQFIIEDRKYF